MTLAFPNPSRSFDDARNAVRFIGHDGMFEVRFFVEAGALAKSDIDCAGRDVGNEIPHSFRRVAHAPSTMSRARPILAAAATPTP